MSLQGSEEFIANLKLIKNWTAVELTAAMGKSLNLIEVSAKASHERGKNLSLSERKTHADDRFYTWSGDLTGSIHSEGAKATLSNITGIVSASEAYAEDVELGTPSRRAFPFMGPGLADNDEKILEMFAMAVKKVIK